MKVCRVCKVELTAENHYPYKGYVANICNKDEKIRVAKRYYSNIDWERKRSVEREKNGKRRKMHMETSIKMIKKYPEKYKARVTLRNAVNRGDIIKPNVCDASKFKGGAEECSSRIEAHHHRGYVGEHALDVLWLCTNHHKKIHRKYNFLTLEK